MHIVLDCRAVHQHMGGIGRAAWELSFEVGRQRGSHKLSLLVGSRVPEGFCIPGAALVPVDAAMIDEPFEQLQLPAVLKWLGGDVYINPTFSLPAVKSTRFQLSVIHDVVFEDRPEWVEPDLGGYLRRWSRFAAAHADRVITVSDHAKSRIADVYAIDPSRIVRIYNGVSESCFVPPAGHELDRCLTKLRLDRPYVLYLGSIEPKKGIPELLRAFGRVARAGFEGYLVLAGGRSGPEYDFEAEVTQLGLQGRVCLPGYVTEKEKTSLLSACELFVYPSLYEGFGFPPLEAMALGRPCVTSAATSVPEISGDAALHADVRDEGLFAETLERGLKDSAFRARAQEMGPKRAREFSWPRAAEELLALCDSLGGSDR